MQRCLRVCSEVSEYEARLESVQGGLSVQRCSGEYARVYRKFGECAASFDSVQQCWGVCSDVKGCAARFGACAASYEGVQRG